MRQQKQRPPRDSHAYVIVVPETGSAYLERMDDSVRAVCRKVIGANHVDVIPCGMDSRFYIVYSVETAGSDGYNRPASRLAQEWLRGPCVVVRGDNPHKIRGFSRPGALKVLGELAEMIGGADDV